MSGVRASRIVATAWLVVASSLPANAFLPTPPISHVLISEVMTGTNLSASSEFVEIYNPSNEALPLDCIRLEYKSGSGGSWTKKAELSGQLLPGHFYLVATAKVSEEYPAIAPDADLSTGLSATGGHVRLLLPDDPTNDCASATYAGVATVDMLGWGVADNAEGEPAPAPEKSQSLKRRYDENGQQVDSDNNLQDFLVSSEPHPESSKNASIPEVETPESIDPETVPPEVPATPSYLSLEITELLPDPATPETDEDDEFVEFYNPNIEPVNLRGYVLKTGSSLQYNYEFSGMIIEPGSYLSVRSSGISMTLPNTSGKATLLNPEGGTASNLVSYSEVVTGESWAIIDDSWTWTDRPTSGSPNFPHTEEAVLQEDEATPWVVFRTYEKAIITELFPDPIAPQKDANDEYVEIYNPGDQPLNLAGYVLKSGSGLRTKHTFGELIIPPQSFIAVFSIDSKISLGNDGGQVQLLDPNGAVISQSDPYDKAKPGASWALIDNRWQWTGDTTPAAANSLTLPAEKSPKTSKAKTRVPKAPTTKAAAADQFATPAIVPSSPFSGIFVVSALGLALLYAIYEYRFEVRNQLELLRRHGKARRAARAKT